MIDHGIRGLRFVLPPLGTNAAEASGESAPEVSPHPTGFAERHPWTLESSPSRRYRYGKDENGMIPIERWHEKYGKDGWGKGDGLQVVPDIQPYKSTIDGSYIGSRSYHRQHLKNNGMIEVGNEDQSCVLKNRPQMSEPITDLKRGMAMPPEERIGRMNEIRERDMRFERDRRFAKH
jgi:hypothetical protein